MISSVVERIVHIDDVRGSNPLSPTIIQKMRPLLGAFLFEERVGSGHCHGGFRTEYAVKDGQMGQNGKWHQK